MWVRIINQHHDHCITSCAPFQLRREHSIIALHHHCNPTSYGCIIIMVSSICTWKILSLPLDGIGIHKHIATSILQLSPIIKSWARMFQKSSPKPFFVYPHLFSPTSVFFMWWSQHCENWSPCIIVVPRSFWRFLFGSENLTWLTYPITLKSRARIKFGCWLKGIIVFTRRP